MPSGSLTLATRWDETSMITKNPEITFFKVVYKRHTCFAIESIKVDFDEPLDFGVETGCTLGPLGDLIHKVYLCITLPAIKSTTTKTVPTHIATAKTITTNMYQYFRTYLNYAMVHYNHCNNALQIQNNTFENIFNTSGTISTPINDAFIAFKAAYVDFNNHMSINTHAFNFTHETAQQFGQIHEWEKKSLDNTSIPLMLSQLQALTIPDREKVARLKTKLVAFKQTVDVHYRKIHKIHLFFTDMFRWHEKQKFAWAKNIGHSIIDTVELLVGGITVQTFTSQTLEMFTELYEQNKDNHATIIGNVSQLTTMSDTVPSYNLYIPLPFWFTRDSTVSLPIMAIPHSQIYVNVKLKSIADCCHSELSYYPSLVAASLYVDYVYLGNDERLKFVQNTIDYIVPVIEMEQRLIDSSFMEILFHLDNKLIKEFMWYVVDETQESHVKHVTFNTLSKVCNQWEMHPTLLPKYSTTVHNVHYITHGNYIDSLAIMLKGVEAASLLHGTYYDSTMPRQRHRITPQSGLYVYCFALNPASIQPSGQCDFSNIESLLLKIQFNHILNLEHRMVLRFFTSELRVMRVMNGKALLL